jgi:hypothetical protein
MGMRYRTPNHDRRVQHGTQGITQGMWQHGHMIPLYDNYGMIQRLCRLSIVFLGFFIFKKIKFYATHAWLPVH